MCVCVCVCVCVCAGEGGGLLAVFEWFHLRLLLRGLQHFHTRDVQGCYWVLEFLGGSKFFRVFRFQRPVTGCPCPVWGGSTKQSTVGLFRCLGPFGNLSVESIFQGCCSFEVLLMRCSM